MDASGSCLNGVVRSHKVLSTHITPLNWRQIMGFLDGAIKDGASAYVSCCTVHTVVEAFRDESYSKIVNSADLRTTDGMPLVWLARRFGFQHAEQICGPDLLLRVCEWSVQMGYRHFFYGGAPGVAEGLAHEMQRRYPGLKVAGHFTPPFRPLSDDEDRYVCEMIKESNADFVWIGLGTPKQDIWMNEHRNKFPGIMFGIGAAFDFYTGRVKRAPHWVRRIGLEWFYRLMSEPRRLWKRYTVYNWIFIKEIVKSLKRQGRSNS